MNNCILFLICFFKIILFSKDESYPSWYPKQSEYDRINQIPNKQWVSVFFFFNNLYI